MSRISISEFCALTGLPDRSVLWLLASGHLRCTVVDERHVEIIPETLPEDILVQALMTAREETAAEIDVVVERILTSLDGYLERAVEEALERLAQEG